MNSVPTSDFSGPLATVFREQASTNTLGELLENPSLCLPVAPASRRETWDNAHGGAHSLTVDGIISSAISERTQAWPQPLASQAARLHRDGNRDEWEALAFERQRRLSRAAIAAASTLQTEWIDEVANGIVLLCEQSSWCWPAHDDALARHDSVLSVADSPFVDLGAGEVVGQLAWVDHLLGDQLDEHYPGLRTRIRREAEMRIFDPFITRRDWHWIGLDGDVHNWNPWIHGNVLVAALRLLDSPDDAARRAHVVALAIEGLDRYVASLPQDGAIDEGYSYWWNGACRALEALDILTHATGGRLDAIAQVPALRATIAFPHSMHLGGDWYLNLADGQSKPPAEQPWHALHRAARRVNDREAQAHAASHRASDAPVAAVQDGLGRLLRGLTDSEWASAQQSPSPLPREVWFGSTEVLVAREHAGDTSGLTLAVKGGHNDEHHNHNDVGSFVVASDGVPVIVDVGRPTYTAATFGPDRYSIWTMQSSWHNVPEIAGTPQSAGAEFRSRDVQHRVSESAASLSLEISAAYPVEQLASWKRQARLERGDSLLGSARVVVADEWQWTSADESTASIHLIIAGSVDLFDGVARVTPLESATPTVIRWEPQAAATTTIRVLDDPMLTDVWGGQLTRLEIRATPMHALSVTIELEQQTGRALS